ncbi:DUF6677 family protein [Mucisphaera calidilacus]|uniref:DUF6677 domain-containing protein n=1 Tax=Mucisphaera calidilacus TaxID=2527982 RepID=A0A518C1C2_9BACT|nr:DUF6677 family protein [Mucisphaera calidilacus]QDU73023.1 hypothetical protein Pan265_29010 [Mucisphaera calidilacus]
MTQDDHQPRWHILAAIAGWLIPGSGHALIGETRRGIILALSILTLWTAGLFIGGISVIDKANHPAWYGCQVLVAPAILVDLLHRSLTLDGQAPPPEGTVVQGIPATTPPFEPSMNRVHEQGTIFTALAGLLNLLAIIDVAYRYPAGRLPQQDPAGAQAHA